ncbi:dCTP deaminase, partial [Bifidobacterium bifidum]
MAGVHRPGRHRARRLGDSQDLPAHARDALIPLGIPQGPARRGRPLPFPGPGVRSWRFMPPVNSLGITTLGRICACEGHGSVC